MSSGSACEHPDSCRVLDKSFSTYTQIIKKQPAARTIPGRVFFTKHGAATRALCRLGSAPRSTRRQLAPGVAGWRPTAAASNGARRHRRQQCESQAAQRRSPSPSPQDLCRCCMHYRTARARAGRSSARRLLLLLKRRPSSATACALRVSVARRRWRRRRMTGWTVAETAATAATAMD